MDEEETRLTDLRSKILNDLQPLVETVDMDPDQKFTIMLATARLNGSSTSYETAYATAQKIQSPEARVNAYLDLLEAIDVRAGDVTERDPDVVDTPDDSSEASEPDAGLSEENQSQ